MKLLNLNCITNSWNWYTYVTWRGNEYELSEDEHDSVETRSSVIIYKLIVILLYWSFYRIILKTHGNVLKWTSLNKLLTTSPSKQFDQNRTNIVANTYSSINVTL